MEMIDNLKIFVTDLELYVNRVQCWELDYRDMTRDDLRFGWWVQFGSASHVILALKGCELAQS